MGVDNGVIARRYMTEIWSEGKFDAIDELVGDDIVLRDPMTPGSVTGKAEVRKRVTEMPKMFGDNALHIKETIVSGDRVVMLTTWRAVHKGDFFGIAGTGKTITCEGVEVLRINNGKVVENESYFDVYTMFQQMGALPSPDKLKPKERAQQTPTSRL